MSVLLRGLHIASKQIVYLLIILITVLILLIAAGYWLTDAVDKRQDEIAVWVGDKVGYPVEIVKAGLSWVDLMPKLQVDGVTVFRQDDKTELLSVQSLYVGLDMIASLRRGEPVLNDLSLTGLNTTIVRDTAGKFQLQGLDLTDQSSAEDIDWSSWVNILNRFQLTDVTINYIDELHTALSGQYQVTQAELSHHFKKWVTAGSIRLPATLGANVEFSGSSLLNWDDLSTSSWQAQAQINELMLAPFSQLAIWQDVAVKNGQLTANISASGIGKKIDEAQTNINLVQATLVSKQENLAHPPVDVEYFKGKIDWQQQAQSWHLAGHDIQIKMNGDAWPATNFNIQKQNQNDWLISSDYLRLSDLTALASLTALSPEMIRVQQPAGDLDNLTLQYSAQQGLTQLAFNLRDGAALPWQDYPGVTGLTGAINWQEGMAKLKLDSHQVTFYPETWLDSAVFFDSVTGELDLQQQDKSWVLQSNALHLWNDDLNIQLDGSVQHASDSKVTNDLKITLQDVVVNRWQAYVPQRILSRSFKKWSKNAFVAGNIIDGIIELQGDLAAFPYEDEPDKGHFKMNLQAENVQLHYAPGWPDLFDVTGLVTGLANDLTIQAKSGKIAGFKFADVTTTISKLVHDEPILRVEGNLTGTTADALLFLQNSPLKQRFGKVAQLADAKGNSNIQLNLMVPLADEDKTQVAGNVSFVDSQLQSKSLPELTMSQINGKLNFTNNGVTAKNIKAVLLAAPVNINVSPRDDATIVSASSQLSLQQVANLWPNVVPKFVSGETTYQAEVAISEQAIGEFDVDTSIQSDLQGIKVDLPEPFFKNHEDMINFRASVKQKDNTPIYAVEYGKLINVLLAQDTQQWRGELSIGAGKAVLPAHGVKVRGQLSTLSLDTWNDWSKQYNDKTQSNNSFIASMSDAVVKVDKLTGFNQEFTNVTLSAKKQGEGWRADIDSAESKGMIYWPDDFDSNTVLKLNFDKLTLTLPKLDDTQKVTDEQTKFLWPSMELAVGSLVINDMQLGELEWRGHREIDAWLLDNGSLKSKEFTALMSVGEWRYTASGDQSHFKVQANSNNLAKLLASFGYQQAIDAKDVSLSADLSWPASPLAVSTKILTGSLKLGLGKGRLKDVEPGAAGRIFGLMSIAALPRRLSLDFNDLFSKGFYFDSIKGSFKFENGQATTNDFVLKGTPATIKMVGPVDLIHQQYDQVVTITPNVSSTLPLAGAVAGGPLGLGVGTAILLVDKLAGALFDKNIVNLVSYTYYLTGPWDEPELTTDKPLATK
ncbi:hypothetical protein LCGC14_0580490 [marine sediment metagenome]|uniref:YhdP central domain-containing protein n=1 Tax=marine sediment metagenome TaxID=412755 RepID=A0A0F9RGJ9_9ZZZZ|nr:TIGR02099 family protein [Methylophaga sp.]